MADPAEYLIVASSARALSAAARRSGVRAYALDLFGDVDTVANTLGNRVVAGDLELGLDATALLQAADQLALLAGSSRFGLVYGAGFEDRPELLEQLSRGRTLCGNSPETVARAKDPRAFFAALHALGIPHPQISLSRPPESDGWLAKRIGASGGSHVVAAASAAPTVTACYYQRHMPGRAIGVSFLANGARAFPLGISEQWTSPTAGRPFRFGGMVQPALADADLTARLYALLDPLVAALGLVGLNSLDVLVEHRHFHALEVNPRPGANLDLYDGADPVGLFARHLRACAGELPAFRLAAPPASAMEILYAEDPLSITTDIAWPDWVADRPAPGTTIAVGAPVCTVLASESSAPAARRLVGARVAKVRSLLQEHSARPTMHRAIRVKIRSGSTA